jgi:hypothetical protein
MWIAWVLAAVVYVLLVAFLCGACKLNHRQEEREQMRETGE